MLSNSIGSATDAKVSKIAKPHIIVKQPVPIPSIHTATYCNTNFLSSSRRMAGSDIPARIREDAVMKPQNTIGSQIVAMISNVLIYTRHWRTTLVSTSIGTSWSTKVLPECKYVSTCTVWQSKEIVL